MKMSVQYCAMTAFSASIPAMPTPKEPIMAPISVKDVTMYDFTNHPWIQSNGNLYLFPIPGAHSQEQ